MNQGIAGAEIRWWCFTLPRSTLDLIHNLCPSSRVSHPLFHPQVNSHQHISAIYRHFEWSVFPSLQETSTVRPQTREAARIPSDQNVLKVSDIAILVVQPSNMWIECVRWNGHLTLWKNVKLSEMIVVWCVHSIFVVWYALTLLFAAINLLCWALVIINRC